MDYLACRPVGLSLRVQNSVGDRPAEHRQDIHRLTRRDLLDMARPCRHCGALLGRKIVPLINRYDPPERPAGMIQAFLDNVNRNAQPRTSGSKGPPEIVKNPRLCSVRHLGIEALFDERAPGGRENEGALAHSRASFQDFDGTAGEREHMLAAVF